MSRRLFLVLTLFVLLFYLIHVKSISIEINASNSYPVHNLDTGLNYTTIQEAINAPETLGGHTIFVEEGVYYEHVVVNKSLSLIGENRNTTIIDGSKSDYAIHIRIVNDVNITGFTIQRGYEDGIFVSSSEGVVLSGNIVISNIWDGVRLYDSVGCRITKNEITDNSGWGISLSSSNHNTISNNTISNNRYGISLHHSSYSTLTGNLVVNNSEGPALNCFFPAIMFSETIRC